MEDNLDESWGREGHVEIALAWEDPVYDHNGLLFTPNDGMGC